VNAKRHGRLFTLFSALAILVPPAIAEDDGIPAPAKITSRSPARTLWKWSLVTYATANALDVVSSVGPHYGHETNSLLADSNGNIRVGRAIALKGGVFGATGVGEYIILRRWPQLTKIFSVVNFGWSGAEFGDAAHNFSLRK
jgi:hypothetical protein